MLHNICDIQDVIKWAKIRRRAWRDRVNRMDANLAKIAKNGKSNIPKLDDFQNIGTKVGYRHHKIGILDKI